MHIFKFQNIFWHPIQLFTSSDLLKSSWSHWPTLSNIRIQGWWVPAPYSNSEPFNQATLELLQLEFPFAAENFRRGNFPFAVGIFWNRRRVWRNIRSYCTNFVLIVTRVYKPPEEPTLVFEQHPFLSISHSTSPYPFCETFRIYTHTK